MIPRIDPIPPSIDSTNTLLPYRSVPTNYALVDALNPVVPKLQRVALEDVRGKPNIPLNYVPEVQSAQEAAEASNAAAIIKAFDIHGVGTGAKPVPSSWVTIPPPLLSDAIAAFNTFSPYERHWFLKQMVKDGYLSQENWVLYGGDAWKEDQYKLPPQYDKMFKAINTKGPNKTDAPFFRKAIVLVKTIVDDRARRQPSKQEHLLNALGYHVEGGRTQPWVPSSGGPLAFEGKAPEFDPGLTPYKITHSPYAPSDIMAVAMGMAATVASAAAPIAVKLGKKTWEFGANLAVRGIKTGVKAYAGVVTKLADVIVDGVVVASKYANGYKFFSKTLPDPLKAQVKLTHHPKQRGITKKEWLELRNYYEEQMQETPPGQIRLDPEGKDLQIEPNAGLIDAISQLPINDTQLVHSSDIFEQRIVPQLEKASAELARDIMKLFLGKYQGQPVFEGADDALTKFVNNAASIQDFIHHIRWVIKIRDDAYVMAAALVGIADKISSNVYIPGKRGNPWERTPWDVNTTKILPIPDKWVKVGYVDKLPDRRSAPREGEVRLGNQPETYESQHNVDLLVRAMGMTDNNINTEDLAIAAESADDGEVDVGDPKVQKLIDSLDARMARDPNPIIEHVLRILRFQQIPKVGVIQHQYKDSITGKTLTHPIRQTPDDVIYFYEMRREMNALAPVLQGIALGVIPSMAHNIFKHGTQTDRDRLVVYGDEMQTDLMTLPLGLQTSLLHYLAHISRVQDLDYTAKVLLPEFCARARVLSKEGIANQYTAAGIPLPQVLKTLPEMAPIMHPPEYKMPFDTVEDWASNLVAGETRVAKRKQSPEPKTSRKRRK
jgi:hypothetical protein